MNKQQVTIILTIIVVIGGSAGLYSLKGCKGQKKLDTLEEHKEKVESHEKLQDEIADPDEGLQPIEGEESPDRGDAAVLEVRLDSPEALMKQVKNILSGEASEDKQQKLIELSVADAEAGKKLQELVEIASGMEKGSLGEPGAQEAKLEEIGELKRGEKILWQYTFPNGKRAFLDVEKNAGGVWKVQSVRLPDDVELRMGKDGLPEVQDAKDSLLVAHHFVKFMMSLNYAEARKLVDRSKISDAKLAGLCIIFEEGEYKLRAHRAIKASIANKKIAAYQVFTIGEDNEEADFSIVLNHTNGKWLVNELNLGKLFEDYIANVADGDTYYTPLVKSPKGGDSLVIYFGFNEGGLSKRTERQLKIVADILLLDEKRVITLTGHTDNVGGDVYNKTLSNKRAIAVKDYLVNAGVSSDQITSYAYGKHRPRQANTKEDGGDNPEGRRANRRTEIYLDF